MVVSKRVNLHLPPNAIAVLDRLATERCLTRTATVRQALGVLQVCHDATRDGLLVGTSADREKLNTVLIAPL